MADSCLHCVICTLIQRDFAAGATPGRIGTHVAQALADFISDVARDRPEARAEFRESFLEVYDSYLAEHIEDDRRHGPAGHA